MMYAIKSHDNMLLVGIPVTSGRQTFLEDLERSFEAPFVPRSAFYQSNLWNPHESLANMWGVALPNSGFSEKMGGREHGVVI